MVEKLFLARISTQAMESAVSSAYAAQIFQGSCVALAMMAQVFVARWHGSRDSRMIGAGVWQFVWFSFLSMILTLPLGILYGRFFFGNTEIKEMALPYFYFLMGINFLYPLGTALSCFFVGRGKTLLILLSTIAMQLLKILFSYLFIFGWGSWIPSFGILGGVISTAIAQGGFCLFLLLIFLKKENALEFGTKIWKFQPKLFWECTHPGLLRAGNRILGFTCWASIAQLMAEKGGNYLLVISIGGVLFMLLHFIGDALCQAQTTLVSQYLGAQKYHRLMKLFYSGTLLAVIPIALFAVPLLFFSSLTFQTLFSGIQLESFSVWLVFLGVWLSFGFYTFAFIPVSYVLAHKDTKFSFFMGVVGWGNGYLLMYLAVKVLSAPAEYFWLILSLMHGSNALFYYLRMRKLLSSSKAAVSYQ